MEIDEMKGGRSVGLVGDGVPYRIGEFIFLLTATTTDQSINLG
jgi:hypothetical protein